MTEAVIERLGPIQARYAELRPDEAAIEEALESGAAKASAIARETLHNVRLAMGVGPTSS